MLIHAKVSNYKFQLSLSLLTQCPLCGKAIKWVKYSLGVCVSLWANRLLNIIHLFHRTGWWWIGDLKSFQMTEICAKHKWREIIDNLIAFSWEQRQIKNSRIFAQCSTKRWWIKFKWDAKYSVWRKCWAFILLSEYHFGNHHFYKSFQGNRNFLVICVSIYQFGIATQHTNISTLYSEHGILRCIRFNRSNPEKIWKINGNGNGNVHNHT